MPNNWDRSRQSYGICAICSSRPAKYAKSRSCNTCYCRNMKATKPEVRKRMVERTKLWRSAAAGTEERRLAIRRANLSRYGITPEQYAQLHNLQSGLCAICGRPETEILRGEPRRLNIDHDHVRNFVRGLLCSGCNKGIGNLGESPERLQKAIDYLANATDAVQKLKGNA